MSTRTVTFGDAAYLLVLGIAVPLAVIHWTLGLYHLAFLSSLLVAVGLVNATRAWAPGLGTPGRRAAVPAELDWPVEARRLGETQQRWAALSAIAPRGELELMERLPAPSDPLLIRVVATSDLCPLGFRQGDTWVLDQTGFLSTPICLPAARSLTALLQSPEAGDGHPVSCHCPLGQRDVVFAAARRN